MAKKGPEAHEPSARLLALLSAAPHLDAFLHRVVELAASVVGDGASCSITVHRNDHPFTTASSDGFATSTDQLQCLAEQGPCLEALRSNELVRTDDLAVDRRWPEFRARAVPEGVSSCLSLPLPVDGRTVGALNLYSRERAAFQGASLRRADAFAAQCAAALTLAVLQTDEAELRRQLFEAIDSRSMIDQAVGILMAQRGGNAHEALALLRHASQQRNRKLRDVAVEIITRVTGQPPYPPSPFRTHGFE